MIHIMPTKAILRAAKVSRRQFLRTLGLTGTAITGFPAIVSARSPNAQLNLGIIGAGGRGGRNLREMQSENIVALCDVNANNLGAAAKQYSEARTYKDFRKFYDEA